MMRPRTSSYPTRGRQRPEALARYGIVCAATTTTVVARGVVSATTATATIIGCPIVSATATAAAIIGCPVIAATPLAHMAWSVIAATTLANMIGGIVRAPARHRARTRGKRQHRGCRQKTEFEKLGHIVIPLGKGASDSADMTITGGLPGYSQNIW